MSLLALRRSVLVTTFTIALAAALLAMAAPAKADPSGSPFGAVDTVNGVPTYYAGIPEGSPHISGWAIDADWWAWWSPVNVRVDVIWSRNLCKTPSGCIVAKTSVTQLANFHRSDLAGTLFGPYHGFIIGVPDLQLFARYDSKSLCVTALEGDGNGNDTSLGCYYLPF